MQSANALLQTDRTQRNIMATISFIVLLFLNGCEGCVALDTPISLDQLLSAGNLVVQALQLMKERSADTSQKVKDDYADLGDFLRQNNVTTPRVQEMEKRHNEMLQSASGFRASLADTKTKADTLFGLLEKRAKQVTTENLKTEMLNETAHKKSEFNLTLDTTSNALQQLDGYIKKYDDILAYMQQQAAMQVLNGYKDDVSKISVQIVNLSASIEKAIDQAMQLVDPSHIATGSPSQETTQVPLTVATAPAETALSGPQESTQIPPSQPQLFQPNPFATQITVTLPEHTPIMALIDRPVPFGAYPEQEFQATLATALKINGVTVLDRGALLHGHVSEAPSPGVANDFQMRLVLSDVVLPDRRTIPIATQLLVTNGVEGNVLAHGTVLRFPLTSTVTLNMSKAQ